MHMNPVVPQANDLDPDDPDIYDTNNHEINESSIQDLRCIEPSMVKDLGDLNTGPAQPILSVSLNIINILVIIIIYIC